MLTDSQMDAILGVFPSARLVDEDDAHPVAEPLHRPGRAAPPRLDLWTHNAPESPHLQLVIQDCGKGNVEACCIVRTMRGKKGVGGKKRSSQVRTSREQMSPEHLERSTRRAVKQVRLSSKVLGADRILTLTSRKYLYNIPTFWLVFKEFNRLMRKKYGSRWGYVCVPELHPKHEDHYHAHLAIAGNYPVDTLRFLWRTSLRTTLKAARKDHTPGNIDIAYKKSTRYARVNGVARYISKYLVKQMQGGYMHEKRYEKSRGLTPVKTVLYADLGLTDLEIIRKVQELSQGVLSRNPRWDVYSGFDCLLMETEPPS